MNEHGFWGKVRDVLNSAPYGFTSKLSDMHVAGTPDCVWAIAAHMGVMELKYVPAWPARADTLITVAVTKEQRRWLDRITNTGNHGHVLLGVVKEWFLLYPHELPVVVDGKPRITRSTLEGVRRAGRAGTFKTLPTLPDLLCSLPMPVYGR